MTFVRLCILSMATMASLAGPPHAQAEPAEIGGVWSFETVIHDKGCTITGSMHIEVELDGRRQCSFTSSEVCTAYPDERITVEQSCRILRQGSFYLIRSRFVRSLTEGYSGLTYLPDQFEVRLVNASRMKGTWHDTSYTDAVTFWRDKMAPSS